MTDVEKWLREWIASEQEGIPLTALTREQVIELLAEVERLRAALDEQVAQ